jgi:hypothetical protein
MNSATKPLNLPTLTADLLNQTNPLKLIVHLAQHGRVCVLIRYYAKLSFLSAQTY